MAGRQRFARQDWLAAGLRQLALHGAAGVKLAPLCRALKRTTGSFYYHFRDHAAFVDALMDHWQQTHTEDLIAAVSALSDADAGAQQLTTLSQALDHRLEVAVRLFAFQNSRVQARLGEIDTRRITFLAGIYAQAGTVPTHRAATVAALEYAAYVGAQMLMQSGAIDAMAPLEQTFADLLSRPVQV